MRAWRHQAAAVVASSPPARLRLGYDHTRREKLEWCREKGLGASVRDGDGKEGELGLAATMVALADLGKRRGGLHTQGPR
jgi:hypothetical protein